MVDVELYGGRRGFLKHVRGRTLYALGAYRSGRDIDWNAVERLAFACKGNICRSPYACARARSLGVQAVSFGLEAAPGARADPAAVGNARVRGIDLSAHRSAGAESVRFTDRDLIIVFEPEQITQARQRIGSGMRAELLGIWSRPVRPHIQDPYGLSDRYFQQCFSVIDASIAVLVDHMARIGAPALRVPAGLAGADSAMHRDSCDGMLD
jgi:protein-tyrosine phosphatase